MRKDHILLVYRKYPAKQLFDSKRNREMGFGVSYSVSSSGAFEYIVKQVWAKFVLHLRDFFGTNVQGNSIVTASVISSA